MRLPSTFSALVLSSYACNSYGDVTMDNTSDLRHVWVRKTRC